MSLRAFWDTSFASVFLNHCANQHARCWPKFPVDTWQTFFVI